MFRDPEMKKRVVAGLIAAFLFALFVQPLITYSSSLFAYVLDSVSQTFADRIYQRAALGPLDTTTEGAFVFLVGGTAVLFAFFALLTLVARKAGLGDFFIVVVVPLLGGLMLVVYSLFIALDLRLNVSFRQRVAILSPHLSEHDEKELVALWASMKSRRDYNALNRRMDEYAQSRGVKLPHPLY